MAANGLEGLAEQYAKLDYKELNLSDAKAEMKRSGIATDGKQISVVVRPYLDLRVESAYSDSIVLEVIPSFDLIATTADLTKSEPLVTSGGGLNACIMGTAMEMWDRGTLTLSFPLPSEFVGISDGVEVYRNDKLLSSSLKGGALTFTMPSSFKGSVVVTATAGSDSDGVAMIGTTIYPTLQAAVDAVPNHGQIGILTTEPLSATVSREIEFTVKSGVQTVNDVKNVTVKAGVGYNIVSGGPLDNTSRTYTISKENTRDPGNTSTFKDVPVGHWALPAIQWAVEEKITSGTTSDTFSPDTPCTRGQIVTFLWRAAGSPEPKDVDNPFTDVEAGEYYYKAVLWAVENGITSGITETTFAPNARVNRCQTVTLLYRAAGSPPTLVANGGFTDVKDSDWYAGAVQWAVANEITNGVSETTFGPDQSCTRGQIVTFLYRAK